MHDRIANDYMPPLMVYGMKLMARWLPQQLIANSYATLDTFRPASSKIFAGGVSWSESAKLHGSRRFRGLR